MMNIKNIAKITIFVSVIFILAVAVWYSPILFKGYLIGGGGGNLILSRNLAQTGIYGAENDLGVLLSSNLVKTESHVSAYGNKLTAVLYAKIFKIWGGLNENELILLSITINALALIIFTLIVLYLFGFQTSLMFALIYILLPFNWQTANNAGSYEFALLFFSLFFFFYLCGKEQKRNYIYLGLSGIFLVLACLARETIFLFLPFFFVWSCWKNPKRYLLYIFIPFLILLSYFWTPNTYLLLFTTQISEKLKSAESAFYMHQFPDPYTYHFNREESLKKTREELTNPEISFFAKISTIKSAANNGFRAPSVLERMEVGLVLFLNHLFRFFSLEDVGGPFIFLLMLFGIYNLRQKNRELFGLSLGLVFSVVFMLSFVILAGRQHLMDFGWILALWIALGLVMVANKIKSRILLVIMVLVTLYGLVVANHVAWNRLFDSSQESLRMQVYNQKIKELDILDKDVIAIPKSVDRYRLNFLSNKSLITFQEETIKNLLEEKKLASAFETFKVKYILGYSPALTEEILKQTEAINIADNSVEITQIEMAPAKMWFLNLVK